MPHTHYDEEFQDGKLIKRTKRVVSDQERARDLAPDRLRAVRQARQGATQATLQQRVTALEEAFDALLLILGVE